MRSARTGIRPRPGRKSHVEGLGAVQAQVSGHVFHRVQVKVESGLRLGLLLDDDGGFLRGGLFLRGDVIGGDVVQLAELIADRIRRDGFSDNKRQNEGENSELNVEEIQETDYNQGVSS